MQRAAVLFDLDGTLTDPHEGIVSSLGYALTELGARIPSAAALTRYIGPPLREVFDELLGNPDEATLDLAVRLYRECYAERGLFENRVYPGIPALLRAVTARDRRACVVTSKPRPTAESILRHFGLRRWVSGVYGSGPGDARGRKAELVAHALASEGLSPTQAIMVGDRYYDVEGARACEVASIGVGWGFGGRAELLAAGAIWLCDDPEALRTTLFAWFDTSP